MGNICAPKTGPALLAGFKDEDLHPNVVEALKVFANAKAVFAGTLRSIEGQYLHSLDSLSASDAKQAAAVRKLLK